MTVMILGFLTLILLVVALVVDSSSYFLTRRDDQAFCDQLALFAAREGSVAGVLNNGARGGGQSQELVPDGATNAETTALIASRHDVTVKGPVYSADPSGRTVRATYTCTERAHPPFAGAFHDDGMPVTATSTAILSSASAGG